MAEAWNVARFEGSRSPPKNVAENRVFRDNGRWVGKVRSPREVNKEKTEKGNKDSQEGPKRNKVLAPVQKEQWPVVLRTGRKYQRACVVTRATLEAYLEDIRKDPLEGHSDCDDDRAFLNSQQNVPKAKMQEL